MPGTTTSGTCRDLTAESRRQGAMISSSSIRTIPSAQDFDLICWTRSQVALKTALAGSTVRIHIQIVLPPVGIFTPP